MIDALFDYELAKQFVQFDENDLKSIEANQKAERAPFRKAFLLKLLDDAERFGLESRCRHWRGDFELSLSNNENFEIRMTLDKSDTLQIYQVSTTRTYLSDISDYLCSNTVYSKCEFLSEHGFVKKDFYGHGWWLRDYSNSAFDFDLNWFAECIEKASKIAAENDMALKKYEKIKKIAELRSEMVDSLV